MPPSRRLLVDVQAIGTEGGLDAWPLGPFNSFSLRRMSHIAESLNDRLPPAYFADVERSAEAPFPLPRRIAVYATADVHVTTRIEIVSRSNKDTADRLNVFVATVEDALRDGVHVLVIDFLPFVTHAPRGMHAAVWQRVNARDINDKFRGGPVTLASDTATRPVSAYASDVTYGTALLDTPLFLTPERFVTVPLEDVSAKTWPGTPRRWRTNFDAAEP